MGTVFMVLMARKPEELGMSEVSVPSTTLWKIFLGGIK